MYEWKYKKNSRSVSIGYVEKQVYLKTKIRNQFQLRSSELDHPGTHYVRMASLYRNEKAVLIGLCAGQIQPRSEYPRQQSVRVYLLPVRVLHAAVRYLDLKIPRAL